MSFFSKILIVSSLFLTFSGYSQNLECCSSKEEIEETLSGYWKIKDDSSKSLYHFWFENGRGNVENVETTESLGKYLSVKGSHSYLYIKEEDASFALEYIFKFGNWISTIKKLDKHNLSLETNGEITDYYKITY
ncbi:hypothetical protein DFR65_101184 [Oceanihabitans sediminis]|uniref:Lipocalin-like domain-containing protein n=1 Tax=Oceanihabitans sediminis TaxID=1812012 RepID=A0A368P573_9FLAO|nr:hypothetical protein [Oceanihabitans sediminis]MDX1772629.1 hypothetical protein [Oceanihabitans sediminis]RBP34296.1 hypothetical protein DFR65_101184 [Oceanihabitans sediminis]RCU57982.1 hypothetical protein DU428_00915 [Oceanihabitans sediminis]